jgi:PKD repeat protein
MKTNYFLVAAVFLLFAGSGCYKKASIPVADFTYHSSNDSVVPDTITFHNLSQNAESYDWDFGDSQTSTNTDPVHIYTTKGHYTVVLKSYGKGREQWGKKNALIIIE